jgi:hypothetical protein
VVNLALNLITYLRSASRLLPPFTGILGHHLDPTTYAPLTSEQFEEQLRMIAGAIEASGKTQVLVFVHGGLNNREAGQRHVDELLQPMSESKEHYYPLFLNWNSDLVDTSIEQLLYIRQGRTSRYLGPLSSPFAVLAALGSGLLRAPLVWGELLANDLNTTGIKALTFPGKRNSEALAEELFALYRQGNPAAIPIALGTEQIETWDHVSSGVRYALTLPTKLLLSPFIDGLGQGAWGNMLRRTQMLFHREDELDVRDYRDDKERLQCALIQGPKGAAYELFLYLENYLKHHQQMHVTLIGHSMGAIVLNRALQEFPDLPVDNIVYMAAACSIDDFRTSVIPYLERTPQARFYNLMLHPAAEAREWQKSLLDLTPRGSLLVWIDNFLAAPHTTLDRTLGSWENMIQVAHIIPLEANGINVRSRITLKAFCVGLNCQAPATHGAFSKKDYKFWEPTFWQVPAGH